MFDNAWILGLISGFILVSIYISITNSIQRKNDLIKSLKIKWGKMAKFRGSTDEFEAISHYSNNLKDSEDYIDDITWNDLGMDEVFKQMNNTQSAIGREYLYGMLRKPSGNTSFLKKFNKLSNSFSENEKERIEVQKALYGFGKTKKNAVSDYIDYILDAKSYGNLIHILSGVMILAFLVIAFLVNAIIGVFGLVFSIAFSIITYSKFKAKVDEYFISVNILVKMVVCADEISKLNIDFLQEYNEKLLEATKKYAPIIKNSWIIESGNVSASMGEVVLQYTRMLTHWDLIKFNNIVKFIKDKDNNVYDLYETLGLLDSAIAVASFRQGLLCWCEPEFKEDNTFEVKDVYHPLLKNPVSNSIIANSNILLTGSNASGKSTFLKTIAINALLSQSIYTSVSREYKGGIFRIYSSMALRDNLTSSDSYYIVEIKSLKRIIDAINNAGKPVLCFIDEVLRGTNTIERIAASSEILNSFNSTDVLCFAATHDIELTSLLDKNYKNYHFQEEVTEDDVKFNFKLYEGPATTRNAIKLLKVIGYDSSIIEGAENRATRFLNEGVWKS